MKNVHEENGRTCTPEILVVHVVKAEQRGVGMEGYRELHGPCRVRRWGVAICGSRFGKVRAAWDSLFSAIYWLGDGTFL
jgi:hypothetical protein